MNESFDISAASYDDVFTNSHIGKFQRKRVHDFLTSVFPKNQSLEILEINCGTGHDAIWLSNQGHRIIATDISEKMIAVANSKHITHDNKPEFRQLDINRLKETNFSNSFDLIFSDFGGLNCLSPTELENFFEAAAKKLKPNGKIIGVLMPKHCLMENLYFILRGDFNKAFRRNTKEPILANVENTLVKTWYYNPKDVKKNSYSYFRADKTKPIGFLIPPSYLENFFKNKLSILKVLNRLDAFLKNSAFLSSYSDHYIISLSKK
ncbi:class I SAM-dependent methyltransferase [Aquimarina litoralis]|uniref:class I SAM-dependent methyltransferase n=1 Tax=Aquimarina litoralis TaxID=584605 RepID=UPI001C584422|nr:class I SAM-dependent methyltransferase [Aquimarina litoralis]MBW1295773.1 methyltransferase domain-containing protein [Aquimarina litoralis]